MTKKHIKKIPFERSRFAKRWWEKELSTFLGVDTKVVKNKPVFGDKIIKCDQRKVKKWFRNFKYYFQQE